MIRFENVVKRYPDGFTAVDDLSLTVPDGQVTVLIGPSGSGKTTSMRMVNRLIPITSGRILVEGRDNRDVPAEELRRKIGYAIQQTGLFPHMTVADNIAVVPRLLGWDEARISRRVDQLLELIGLDPDMHRGRYPSQLSGGQQQRVGVARALGADPPIMLMDEPFGAVDPITRETLQDEFLQVQEEIGKTILFVTHDIDEAIKMGDRIAIMREGKLVQYDPPDVLLAEPRDDFVRSFVGADRQLKRLGLVHVSGIMNRSPAAVGDQASAGEALAGMQRNGVNTAFVVDEQGRLVGWVDEADLQSGSTLAAALQAAPYQDVAISEDASVREALSAMLARGFQVTPVVDDSGHLRGSVTLAALQQLVEHRAGTPEQQGER